MYVLSFRHDSPTVLCTVKFGFLEARGDCLDITTSKTLGKLTLSVHPGWVVRPSEARM